MLRALALVALMVLIAAPAAWAQPDERLAARAFADAGLRFRAAIEAIRPQIDRLPEEPERRCVVRALRRIPERHWDEVNLPGTLEDVFGAIAELLEDPLMRFSLELHSVQTSDPALRTGRTMIRRVRRAYAMIQALPPVDECAEIRRWVSGGFEPTPAIRRERQAFRAFIRLGRRYSRRLQRTEERLRALGVPAHEADVFDGEIEDEPPPSSRRQVPAPSSPPTAPRTSS